MMTTLSSMLDPSTVPPVASLPFVCHSVIHTLRRYDVKSKFIYV